MQQRLSYRDRIALTEQVAAHTLLTIIDKKETNLIVAADVRTKAELLELADKVGPHICALKTHIEIIRDFDQDLIRQLIQLSKKHSFLLFEDRKFSDIAHTVAHQSESGIHQRSNWADMATAHSLSGPGVITGLQITATPSMGIVLVAQMSCDGNLITPEYTEATISMANNCPESVIGFICQQRLSENPSHIHMAPGIKFNGTTDDLGQNYTTPEDAINHGIDCIIVGRAIYLADKPAEAAQSYKEAAWQAYLQSLNA